MYSLAFRKQIAAFVSRQKQIQAEFDNARLLIKPLDSDVFEQRRNDNATSLDELCDVTGFSASGIYEILAGHPWTVINYEPNANSLMEVINGNIEFWSEAK